MRFKQASASVAASAAPAPVADKGEGERNAVKACNLECFSRYSFVMFSFKLAATVCTRRRAVWTASAARGSIFQSPRPAASWTPVPQSYSEFLCKKIRVASVKVPGVSKIAPSMNNASSLEKNEAAVS